MMFLKLTRSAKTFFTRFGWLIAELVFVFLGLYGAFLLERMHDEEMDQMRKRQILQALVDEFTEYEKELGGASTSLDEGYGMPFFAAYGSGERPFPTPIPYGGMGSVNTGIWEAMLQSGGIEVLEVEVIQKVQVFFKKLQDLLDLYSRFERLTETMILPEMDQETAFFYEPEGPELRDKFKWYVNSLFTIGMSLRELSEQATDTRDILATEFDKIRLDTQKSLQVEEDSLEVPEEEEWIEEPEEPEENVYQQAIAFLAMESENLAGMLALSSSQMGEKFAMPFLTSYTEGERPVPVPVSVPAFQEFDFEPLTSVLEAEGIDDILENELLEPHRVLLEKLREVRGLYQGFSERCTDELSISSVDGNASKYYPPEGAELKESFTWYPNTLYTLVTALGDCEEEAAGAVAMIDQAHPGLYESLQSGDEEVVPEEPAVEENNSTLSSHE